MTVLESQTLILAEWIPAVQKDLHSTLKNLCVNHVSVVEGWN